MSKHPVVWRRLRAQRGPRAERRTMAPPNRAGLLMASTADRAAIIQLGARGAAASEDEGTDADDAASGADAQGDPYCIIQPKR